MSSDLSNNTNNLNGPTNQDLMTEKEPEHNSFDFLGISYWIWAIIIVVIILVIVLLVLWYKGYFTSGNSTGTTNNPVNNPTAPSTATGNNPINPPLAPPSNPVVNPTPGSINRRTYYAITTSLNNQKLYLWADQDRKVYLKTTPPNYDVTFNPNRSISFTNGNTSYILVCDTNGYNMRIIFPEVESQSNVQRVLAWQIDSNSVGTYRLFNPHGDILYIKYDQAINAYQLAFTGNDKAKSEGWQHSGYTVERIQ